MREKVSNINLYQFAFTYVILQTNMHFQKDTVSVREAPIYDCYGVMYTLCNRDFEGKQDPQKSEPNRAESSQLQEQSKSKWNRGEKARRTELCCKSAFTTSTCPWTLTAACSAVRPM